mgnify:CR=1 FL=1
MPTSCIQDLRDYPIPSIAAHIYIWFISQINKEKKYSPVRYDTFGYGLQSDFFSAIVKVFDMMMVT